MMYESFYVRQNICNVCQSHLVRHIVSHICQNVTSQQTQIHFEKVWVSFAKRLDETYYDIRIFVNSQICIEMYFQNVSLICFENNF